eukprot:c2859_g1_i1 orf=511-1287(-)
MTLQAILTQPAKVGASRSLLLPIHPRQVGWGRAGFCGGWRRPPLLQVMVGSSRNPGRPRAPIWRGRLLSNEALRVVQELKRARASGDDARLSTVLKSKAVRLLKFDMLAVLTELQRQNECELALKIFDIVRKEFWYEPDEALFSLLVVTLARNERIEEVDKLYTLAAEEGLQPSVRFYTEVLSAQVGAGNLQKAVEVYDELRKAGFAPCDPAYGILRKGLVSNGDFKLADELEKEYKEFYAVVPDYKEEADVEHVVYG